MAFLSQQWMGRELIQSEDTRTRHVDAWREAAFEGDAGDKTITPTLGLAWSIDGGACIDTIVFPATLAQMHIEASATDFRLQRMNDGAMLELVEFGALDAQRHPIGLGPRGPCSTTSRWWAKRFAHWMQASARKAWHNHAQKLLGADTPGRVMRLLWTQCRVQRFQAARLQPFIDRMAQGLTGGVVAVLDSNLALKAMRIDLIGLADTGIEFA
ncbi:hypothetical protein [Acidovorax sp. CCYZU-2555]|uniref:hypothetical protein n=1 Tax=Acidovorax sp. CCYZU-2555 TaxID=2835042 RepID=UPI001BCFD3B5|nr:hypothetical protein [Acidovorax sp. CCYZU-2555]MBS7780758.1 hypothetical protein [Acidovorax sp. CCYZU-2555]